jgi:hypothetical protein
MTGILQVDTVTNESASFSISSVNFKRRIIQRTNYIHRTGWWRANNTYYWIPGAFMDFRPIRGDSRIRASYNIFMRQYGTSNHTITHYIFYVDELEYGRFSRSGHHVENTNTIHYDVPSWGADAYRRIGFKARSYSEGSHNSHLWHTQYWDGASGAYDCPGQMIIEEYVPV